MCLSNGWGGWPQRPQRPRILRVCYCFNYGPPAAGWGTGQPSPSKTQPSQIHAQKSSELIAFLQQLHTSWIPGLLSSPKIRQSTIYYAGLLGQWDKRIFNPSIIFLILFIDLGNSKLFIFIFVILWKKICNFMKFFL